MVSFIPPARRDQVFRDAKLFHESFSLLAEFARFLRGYYRFQHVAPQGDHITCPTLQTPALSMLPTKATVRTPSTNPWLSPLAPTQGRLSKALTWPPATALSSLLQVTSPPAPMRDQSSMVIWPRQLARTPSTPLRTR